MPRLSPQQLCHAVKFYRAEVGEKTLPKPAMKYLNELQKQATDRRKNRQSTLKPAPSTPARVSTDSAVPTSPVEPPTPQSAIEEDEVPEHLLLDPSLMLPFQLPTSTDMLISYGAGFGGMNRERARKYIPTVPPEFLAKLDVGGGRRAVSGTYDNARYSDDL